MNLDQNMFTKKELEALARAYLDCRLTKVQEKELEIVLSSCDVSSPIIDEARDTMLATTAIEACAPARDEKKTKRRVWFRWWAAAACIALAAGAAIPLIRHAAASQGSLDSAPYIVYVDGKRLETDEAAAAALATQSECMAMMAKTINTAAALQAESTSIISKNN
ncbi:MAG: hypothetical protein K2F72_05795 [Muribaculaceae bacterium]|nr:hypothetical protein [Muribaculaceae bacterium]